MVSLIVKKDRVEKLFFLFVIVVSGLSTILRPSIDSNITLFRLILPFAFFYFSLKNTKYAIIFFLITFFMLLYTVVVSKFLSRFNIFDVTFFFHYVVIVFYYFFVKSASQKIGLDYLNNFIRYFLLLFIFLGYIQLLLGGTYINTQNRLPAVNIFFWNENEFSAVLFAFLLLYYLFEKSKLKYLIIIAATFLIIHNEARLVIIALLLFFITDIFLKIRILKNDNLKLIFLLSTIIITLIILKDVEIIKNLTFQEVVIYPINQILLLEPVYNIGSINNRLNAIIYGTIELKNSYFFGIGPGNSITMMIENIVPGTEKFTAYSMHNFIYQTVVELGFLGFIFLIYLISVVYKSICIKNNFHIFLKITFYLSLSLAFTMLSGPHTNFFFQFIFFYSIYFFRNFEKNR